MKLRVDTYKHNMLYKLYINSNMTSTNLYTTTKLTIIINYLSLDPNIIYQLYKTLLITI